MTFLQLYGEALSRELGSADTSALFTTARRKAAINEGQRWFVTQTECLQRTEAITLVDGTAEYDLEAEIADADFLTCAKQGIELHADPGGGGDVVYYAGEDFPRTSVEWLNRTVPGWRSETAGVPRQHYVREDGGRVFVGLVPAPDIPGGATWTLQVPYQVIPVDLTADGDLPFTVAGNPLRRLIPWHDALAYYGASELEKLRKGTERSLLLRQQAEGRVVDYLDKQRRPGGKVVGVVRSYRTEARGRSSDYGPYDDPWK